PAQMGLLIHERANTLDVTATIIDLAVRGYVKITEVPAHGWFGHVDWELTRLKPADPALLAYERTILDGLFDTGDTRKLSELKNKFYKTLAKAKDELYKDVIARRWFPRNPEVTRVIWVFAGFLAAGAGLVLTIQLGKWLGAGLVGLPVVI